MIGHRSEDFQKSLPRRFIRGFRQLFGTKQPVFLSTSSAWGVMEASIRNLVDRGVLCCMCGAFSDKWFDVAKRCGKNAEPLQVEWGKHIDPKEIDARLATGKFDTVTLIHSETSTGVMNPLPEICCTLAKYPDVALDRRHRFLFLRASRSRWTRSASTSCSPARKKRSPFRPAFRSSRASEKAFARAEKIPNRGYYFDFLEFKKQQAEWMTPSTPSIGHIHALQSKLDEIFEEGLDARFARHARTNALVHDWVRRAGFDFFAEEGFRTKTLTCVKNSRGIDVLAMAQEAARETSPRHRSRLRQDQRQDIPPLEHGRRNRRDGFASARLSGRLPRLSATPTALRREAASVSQNLPVSPERHSGQRRPAHRAGVLSD